MRSYRLVRSCARRACMLLASTTLAMETAYPVPPDVAKPRYGNWGVETQYISEAVKPGDDFFTYVNQGWMQSTHMPRGFSVFGSFNEVGLRTEGQINSIILDSAKSTSPEADPRRQISELYASYMDTARIERLGLTPIRSELEPILRAKSLDDIARLMADPTSSSLVYINVFPDPGNPKRYLVMLDQLNGVYPILGLPGRDYYVRNDEAFPRRRTEYIDYITKTFESGGIDRAAQRATDILALETKLAASQWGLEKLRDRKANYHLMKRQELADYAPGFPWQVFLDARQVGDVGEIVLGTDTAVQSQARVFAETPVDVWSSYLMFHWIANQADLLPAAFQVPHFEFYSRRLNGGAADQRPREKRAIQFVNQKVRDAVGRIYVERYFPPRNLAKIRELVGYLRRAFAERISTLDWMDEKTRAQAQAKLATFKFKLGYPQAWRDYSKAHIRPDDVLGNNRRLLDLDWEHSRSLLNGPVGRASEWNESPQTVDASFNPVANAIEVPAAILQAPFFDPLADPAVNFGAIGAVIGHEMGHGFDDQGARFDSEGRLNNWWTADSAERFKRRTDALVEQYNAVSPLVGVHLNGKQSLGENIGDLTGVTISYRAYHLYLREHGGQPQVLDGYTGDQRFFLSFGQQWRVVWTPEALRAASQGYHPPSQYRVNGVVRNVDAWYDAFDVTSAAKLYLPSSERVRLW
ncbi:MAG TPA: M13 family metallopeptidase [Steroidobacteraceae bacterium]